MKRTRNERGTALIETAITIPIILLVCVGIFEFGRAYQTWEVLTNAAREGARVAILSGTTDQDIRDRVNQYMRDGGVLKQGESMADSNIVINRTVPLTANATASQVQVDLPFQFMVLNPVIRLINPSDTTTGADPNFQMHARAVMRNE
jgi:Flp pilus assembly protein TadG